MLAQLAEDVGHATAGRAPRAGNLHVTVAFVGDVARERLPDLAAIGARAASATAPFVLALDCLGLFRKAGVAWIGPRATPPDLLRMFESLREGLQAATLPAEERDFHPHVTLARRCLRALPDREAPLIAWRVDTLQLMASETLPDAPRYRELASWPLSAS